MGAMEHYRESPIAPMGRCYKCSLRSGVVIVAKQHDTR